MWYICHSIDKMAVNIITVIQVFQAHCFYIEFELVLLNSTHVKGTFEIMAAVLAV